MQQDRLKISLFVIFSLIQLCLLAQSKGQPEGPPDTEAEFEKQYQERITKDRLFNVYIPKNLEDAMLQLDKNIPREMQEKYKSVPEDTICMIMHNRLGVWIINNWGFYGGSRLSHYLRSAGVSFPDDMADLILIAYHRHLHGKTVTMRELAKPFREKRKKEREKEIKEGKILKEEKRIRPREAGAATPAQKAKGGRE
jgi:hypothetical protein